MNIPFVRSEADEFNGAPAFPACTLHEADVTNHLARAHGVARRLLGCDHLADDAVQEAVVALWQQATPPPNPLGWLLRAVTHRCRHIRRTLRRRVRHEGHAASADCALHAGCDNPLHEAYAHELGERLAEARSSLPAALRATIELFETTGLDYAGIAERLSLPIGTVRSRLHRARAALRHAVGDS
ncbi:MAG: sigma-70 family RNA polymerase sigma factor [Planctomycetota bacterium]